MACAVEAIRLAEEECTYLGSSNVPTSLMSWSGGPGPRIESWAYAVDILGLQALEDTGAHHVRECKGCAVSGSWCGKEGRPRILSR